MSPCCSAHPWPPPWPFLVTAPDTAGVLMSFTTSVAAKEDQRIFQLIRLVLQEHTPSPGPSRWPFRMVLCLLFLRLYICVTILSVVQLPPKLRTTARQLGVNIARTTPRTPYNKPRDILHNAAVNYPRRCLPRAPIVLRRYVLGALHSDSLANSQGVPSSSSTACEGRAIRRICFE
jgi:hypothetical protein